MQIIDLREWVLTDRIRIKKAIFKGDKSRKLIKRELHINRILAVYAHKEFNTVVINLPSGQRSVSYCVDDQKNIFKSQDWYTKPDNNT